LVSHLTEVHRLRVLEKVLSIKLYLIGMKGRKLHNLELHNFYSSPSIHIMIKSRKIRWAGDVL
jgi:indole-3-glycerol phosphate synthase